MADDITSLDEIKYDPSRRAEAVLDRILGGDSDAAPTVKKEVGMPVAEALAAKPVLDQDTGRTASRVLFVTTKEAVLVPDSAERQYFASLSAYFDEVHVFCLVPRRGREEVERSGQNLWIYPVRAKHWWSLPGAARREAVEALTWSGGFRPDLIVGVDPFEAGLSAHLIARKFKRPLQYHIYTNPYAPDYKKAAPDNNWRIRIANFLLRRAKSVRTDNGLIKSALTSRFTRLKDIAVLPRFYNFTGLLSAAPAFSLKERYPGFSFIMLAFGPLTANSHLHDLFSATHRLLRSPRVGLIVVGDGPAKALFEQKIKLLEIEKSVVFQKSLDDLASYLKGADVLVECATEEESEVRVLQAAAAGLPIVAITTDLRADLFKDGQSALLCQPGDLVGIGQKIAKLINTTALRNSLTNTARFIAENRLHEDPNAHYQAIADSIEAVLNETPEAKS